MCDFSNYPPIPYPYPNSPERTIKSLVGEARSHIEHGRKEDARSILITLQRAFPSEKSVLQDELDELWEQCGYPRPANITPYNEDGGATNNDNRPPGYELDELARESNIPKRTNNPRKFTLGEGFFEKMLKIIFLTKKNHWYKLRNSDKEPSDADVYYWYGVLLDYRFDNKTGKLYEKMSPNEIKSLAQDYYDFAEELKKMSKEKFKNIKNS